MVLKSEESEGMIRWCSEVAITKAGHDLQFAFLVQTVSGTR